MMRSLFISVIRNFFIFDSAVPQSDVSVTVPPPPLHCYGFLQIGASVIQSSSGVGKILLLQGALPLI